MGSDAQCERCSRYLFSERDAERIYDLARQQEEIKYLRGRIKQLEHANQQLMDPIVRAKMLEPAPPIFMTLPEANKIGGTNGGQES